MGLSSEAYGGMRFAVSPMWETVTSRWLLLPNPRAISMLPWLPTLQDANRRMHPELRAALDALLRRRVWMPDFLTPAPMSARPSFDEELALVAATPEEQARHDLLATEEKAPLTALGRRMAEDPATWVPRLSDALHAWWELAVAPMWPRLQAVLEADIGYRSTILADLGPKAVLESLHPGVSVDNDVLSIGRARLPMLTQGRTASQLICLPSVILDGHPTMNILPETPTTIIYGVRSPGTVWERDVTTRRGSLSAILGTSRAALLELAVAPHTTSRLAERTGLSVSATSMQMAALAAAGLVSRRREGRVVWHVVTDLGRSLLHANGVRVD